MELTPTLLTEFLHEAVLCSRANHPKVVSLVGAVVQPPTLCLVYEYMNMGSLFSALYSSVLIGAL